MRDILPLLAAVLLAGACSKSSAPSNNAPQSLDTPKPGSKKSAMTTLERVKQWAGPDTTVMPVEDIAVDGLALFWLASSPPGAHDLDRGKGIAVVQGAERWLEGKEAMRAVLDLEIADPARLARLAMLLLEDGGQPITALESAEMPAQERDRARQAGVSAPRVQEGALVYWSYYRRTSRPGLMRSHLDLSTLEVERRSLAALQADSADAVDLARTWLASPDAHTRRNGIERLVAQCTDPRAPKLLAETLAKHARADTRALAAEKLATCHDDGSVAALVQALEGDDSAEVRQWAASTLGELGGGPAARRALETARAGDQDENVRLMAQMALAKLK